MRINNLRAITAGIHDLFWSCVVWICGFYLRYGATDLTSIPPVAFETLPVVLAIQLTCFMGFGLYQGMWRYASWHDLRRIFLSVSVSALVVASVILLWRQGAGVPRSVLILNPLAKQRSSLLFFGTSVVELELGQWFRSLRSEERRVGKEC